MMGGCDDDVTMITIDTAGDGEDVADHDELRICKEIKYAKRMKYLWEK